jgi:hypothetical protein
MNITFGICTTYEDIPRLNEVISSIKTLNAPNAEIIVVGSYQHDWRGVDSSVQHILTDGGTPVKTNLLAKFARYDTLWITSCPDLFDPVWYSHWTLFHESCGWDVITYPRHLCVKRDFLRATPFNEDVTPSDSEDLDWCTHIRDTARIFHHFA